MSTALSMHSPHNHGAGAFASSLQLSPAFRSLHAAALRQRQAEFDRLRELARSDEFSDDESDGDEDEVEEDDGGDEEEKEEDDDEDKVGTMEVQQPLAVPPPQHQALLSPRDAASDSDIDSDETVLLPFIRPTIANGKTSRAPHEAMSPKTDEWMIIDKSPTCEGMVFGKVNVSESWFATP